MADPQAIGVSVVLVELTAFTTLVSPPPLMSNLKLPFPLVAVCPKVILFGQSFPPAQIDALVVDKVQNGTAVVGVGVGVLVAVGVAVSVGPVVGVGVEVGVGVLVAVGVAVSVGPVVGVAIKQELVVIIEDKPLLLYCVQLPPLHL